MNRGRGRIPTTNSGRGGPSWRGRDYSNHIRGSVGVERHAGEDSSCSKHDGMSPASGSRHSKHDSAPVCRYMPKKPLSDGTGIQLQKDTYEARGLSDDVRKDVCSLSLQSGSEGLQPNTGRTLVGPSTVKETESCECLLDYNISHKLKQHKPEPSQGRSPECSDAVGDFGQAEWQKPFDICQSKSGAPFMLKPSLLEKNREKRNESKRSMEAPKRIVLRSGMVLLKKYLSLNDQVNIVKDCRDLGLASGGFYQPCYSDGAKLHLKMMCLGKDWDPEKHTYGDIRPIDQATPPAIPYKFSQLIEKAIKDSHALIQQNSRVSHAEDILPWMSPNICIVNFYPASGRLGLHQDRDESPDSLHKGLPVVSFSIGDSAEFLYGDHRDVDKAEKVELESGDVLIFGGKSRHIFHGVTAIKQNTAPKALLQETNLRQGRLNLTFREY